MVFMDLWRHFFPSNVSSLCDWNEWSAADHSGWLNAHADVDDEVRFHVTLRQCSRRRSTPS